MSAQQSVRQFAEEWKAEIDAKGLLLKQDPWALPTLYHGSLLDIPETPESWERIEWLKQQIADLQRQKQEREGVAVTSATNGVTQDAQSLPPHDRMPTP